MTLMREDSNVLRGKVEELLAGNFDEEFLRPKDCVVQLFLDFVGDALDAVDPSCFEMRTFGDGGVRLNMKGTASRRFSLNVSGDQGIDGIYHPMYLFWDGDGNSGIVDDVTDEEFRKRLSWLGL